MPAHRMWRHGLRTRCLHATNAIALLVLLATGLALGDRLPPALVAGMGGHAAINAVHQELGLVFAIAALALVLLLGPASARLLRALARWQRSELRWPLAYLRHLLQPQTAPPPWHGGYFDPLERLVLSVLLATTAVAAASGVYLYFLPPAPRWIFVVVMRGHIASAWLLLGALALHVFAGLGLLPTHRGLWRAMFGDGSVPARTAHTLWPRWARMQPGERDAAHHRAD